MKRLVIFTLIMLCLIGSFSAPPSVPVASAGTVAGSDPNGGGYNPCICACIKLWDKKVCVCMCSTGE